MTPRVVLFTHRNRSGQSHVSRCVGYEFEDVLRTIDDVHVFAPASDPRGRVKEILRELGLELGLDRQRLGRAIRNNRLYKRFGTGVSAGLQLPDCELFICNVLFAHQLLALPRDDWRARCRYAACWVEEMWRPDVAELGPEIEVLKRFDHVFCSCAGTVEALAERIGRPVTYLPPGVDAVRFSPWPDPWPRSIDVCGVGRRSPVTHAGLLRYANETGGFYFYDTIEGQFLVSNAAEHRLLYSNIVKTSRYFIANRAKFNSTDETEGQEEIGYRFFEGLAGGAVLLGDHPDTEAFREHLGWQDAVIRIPFDCPDIADILEALDREPERLEAIRRRNVDNVLRRHDWLHRWVAILDAFGLSETEAMAARRRRLDDLRAHIGAPSDDAPRSAAAAARAETSADALGSLEGSLA